MDTDLGSRFSPRSRFLCLHSALMGPTNGLGAESRVPRMGGLVTFGDSVFCFHMCLGGYPFLAVLKRGIRLSYPDACERRNVKSKHWNLKWRPCTTCFFCPDPLSGSLGGGTPSKLWFSSWFSLQARPPPKQKMQKRVQDAELGGSGGQGA